MSLRQRIILSFFLGAFIIIVLAVFEYTSYIQIRGEIRQLEITDNIRTYSLQLRRHEKNYLMTPSGGNEELKQIYLYLDRLQSTSTGYGPNQPGHKLSHLSASYLTKFNELLRHAGAFDYAQLSDSSKNPDGQDLTQLLTMNLLDKPALMADYLSKQGLLTEESSMYKNLYSLQREILSLRRTGEQMIEVSRDLDNLARQRAERTIYTGQVALLVVIPLFLILGLGALFVTGNNIVRRLGGLTELVERISSRYMPGAPAVKPGAGEGDEVAQLSLRFRRMDAQLAHWELELIEKTHELTEARKLAAIGTMAAGVAHELNNPLNNIFLSTQVLQKALGSSIDPKTRGILDDINGQTIRVKGIVGDLLLFARKREPVLQPIGLAALIRNVFQTVSLTLNTSKTVFILKSPPEDIVIQADQMQLERVFINLFSNALDAMPEGGELSVTIRKVDDGKVKIWVSDSGEGIGPDVREKIFDPFFTARDKGTGLGLAIVLSIVKKHDGSIAVDSKPGGGATFEITLPIRIEETRGI